MTARAKPVTEADPLQGSAGNGPSQTKQWGADGHCPGLVEAAKKIAMLLGWCGRPVLLVPAVSHWCPASHEQRFRVLAET